MTAPSNTTAFMPIKAPACTWAPWTVALWPMLAPSSILVSLLLNVPWITAPSWIFTRGPMVMGATSPRMTQLNQHDAFSPM